MLDDYFFEGKNVRKNNKTAEFIPEAAIAGTRLRQGKCYQYLFHEDEKFLEPFPSYNFRGDCNSVVSDARRGSL